MAWEWSHTTEASENLRLQLEAQDREFLETVYAEWKSTPGGFFREGTPFGRELDERRYERARSAAKYIPTDILAEKIYEWSEKQSTCSNGGWEAWTCPYGCEVHQLPFAHPRDFEVTLDLSEGVSRPLKCRVKGDDLLFFEKVEVDGKAKWIRVGSGLWNDYMRKITDNARERDHMPLSESEKLAFEDAITEEIEAA